MNSQVSPNSPVDRGRSVDPPFAPFRASDVDGSIVDRFEAIAGRFANRIAIEDMTVSLTFA
jgi:hypothetical protein